MGTQDSVIIEVRDGNTRYYYYRSERWEQKIVLLQK